jgi:uncharacterized protein (DUF433 family)
MNKRRSSELMATHIPDTVDLSKYIETRLMGDRPHVRGRRLPVAWLAAAARANGYDLNDLAENYTLNEAQILAALLYYREHEAELEAQEALDSEAWNALKAASLKAPSSTE